MKPQSCYLTKHHQTYVFKKRVSVKLKSLKLPEFKGKTFYIKSLKTDSLSEALRLRDIELARLERLERGDIATLRAGYRKRLESSLGRPSPSMPNKSAVQREVLDDLSYAKGDYADYYYDSTGEAQMDYLPEMQDDAYIQALETYLSELRGGTIVSHDTFRDALELTVKEKSSKGVSAKEISRYKNSVKTYLNCLGVDDIPLMDLKRRDSFTFIEYLKGEGLSEKTILDKTIHLSNVFKVALSREMVQSQNPFTELGLSSKIQTKRDMYSHEEVTTIYNALPDDSKLIWKTLYLTGLRPDELFSFDASSLVWKESQSGKVLCFSVKPNRDGKTEAATRFVPLHKSLIDDYKDFNGYPISKSTFQKRRLETVISCYDESFAKSHDTYSLRHTFTSTLIDALDNEKLVQWLIGHSVSGVTFTNYFHGYRLDRLNDAVQLIKPLD